ncbi:hypothetical protein D3C76_1783510 [compost metagenome]
MQRPGRFAIRFCNLDHSFTECFHLRISDLCDKCLVSTISKSEARSARRSDSVQLDVGESDEFHGVSLSGEWKAFIS